jgi:biotin carboxyl carrier protein
MDGFTHEIEITDETKAVAPAIPHRTPASVVQMPLGLIAAPMPGMVVKILAAEGDLVNQGDKIIIVEAMKMENALSAPISGVVKKIYVAEEQPVDKDALLMEIEATL